MPTCGARLWLVELDIADIGASELLEEHRPAFHHQPCCELAIEPRPSPAVTFVTTPLGLRVPSRLISWDGSATMALHAAGATPGAKEASNK